MCHNVYGFYTHAAKILTPFSAANSIDALLALGPLDLEHVKKCNQAEAEFWRRCEGFQTKPSDKLLQFDCGGQVSYLCVQCYCSLLYD